MKNVAYAGVAEALEAQIAEALEALEVLGLGNVAEFKTDLELLFGNEI